MRTLLLTITLALLFVGCDGKKNTAEVSESKDNCTSTADYETGLKNGLRVAPPCDITKYGTYTNKCNGEYDATTWTSCFGERTLASGEKYRGGYYEGKANGKGEFVNLDGTRYVGLYLRGQRNGQGKEYSANGEVIKDGEWVKGVYADNSGQQEEPTLQQNQTTAQQKNITLDSNEANCKKINGYGTNDKMALATTFNVSISTISFIGARWMQGQYGISNECLLVFDTAVGPKKCPVINILSDDGGKSAFAAVDFMKMGTANHCYPR
jgi:hypothetical protein